ncbi:MAG TPA: hypothetical protein DFR83_19435, partial [Deltaproteobacteria bacterium]|nr:hypothetical protein [Deltaproteobacteria bacterium]
PRTAEAFEEWLEAAWQTAVAGPVNDIDMDLAPVESRQYYRNSIRTQRTARFFVQARQLLEAHVDPHGRAAARAAVRRLEDGAFSGVLQFDDADTGTYHSFGKDEPFVHYLQVMLDSLPADESDALYRLPPHQQEAVRRQRRQATAHLDYLMRHKYARKGIWETDIERRLGGLLIERETRCIVSETPESRERPSPQYECLRIEPMADHPDAGAWVHRSGAVLRREDGTPVDVAPPLLRRIPVSVEALTFLRAKDDPRLREGVRFDWDGNGWLSPEAIGWVDWAGHCDVKAVMEQLGITLTGSERNMRVTEFRSDTGETTEYSRDLLVEMIASVMELGSLYARTDGSGVVRRGVTHFGGARNDQRPDRLQFADRGPGQGLRWPLSHRQDTLVVRAIERGGESLDLGRVFHRFIPVEEGLDFVRNPLFEKTIEGDYSLLDISGSRVVADILEDGFDGEGYPVRGSRELVIDLTPEAQARAE